MKTLKELQKAWSSGGKKAAANMTPEARKQRALKAVKKREEKKGKEIKKMCCDCKIRIAEDKDKIYCWTCRYRHSYGDWD